jgi:metal transporter CNNM
MDPTLEALRWPAVILLICCSALFSGLTLGMLSLGKVELEVVAAGEDKRLAACADKIIPVRKNGNLLLCTLLIGNTSVNSLSSILMADLTGGLMGFLISTAAILFLGEIIPQAVCSRYALEIGSRVIWIVKFFIVLFYPLAKPVSLLLDLMLGEEIGTIHTRQELSKLLQIHVAEGALDAESGNILQGALKALNTMKISELVTPLESCYMLHISQTLDFQTMSDIFETGFSRIPVFDKSKSDVIALLFAKDLILVDPDDQTPLKYFISIFGRPFITFKEDIIVKDAFVKFKQGHSHLALVRAGGDILGVVTLEDIVEEIIQGEIFDESDHAITGEDGVRYTIPVKGGGSRASMKRTRSKFRLLNAESRDVSLGHEEVEALTRHILQNVPLLAGFSPVCLKWVLEQSQIVLIDNHDQQIYAFGVVVDFATIVLTGRLDILSSQNELQNEAGSFSILAPEALLTDRFIPSFSARIGSDTARIVRIRKSVFEAARTIFLSAVPDHVTANHLSGANLSVRQAFAHQLYHKKRSDQVHPDVAASDHPDDTSVVSGEPLRTHSSTGRFKNLTN